VFDGQIEAGEHHRLTVLTRDAGAWQVAEPRNPLTKTTVSVAIRPEKVKLSHRGPVADTVSAQSINRLQGVVRDVSYLGGLTTYKVKLDSGAMMHASMANTTRIDMDAYGLGQRVVAWFTPDDCMVLER
jgi:putrescine transport system ATP-binding protein